MKFLFASDSFKGTLSSEKIISLLTESAEKIFPGCETFGVPVADGGEGTVDAAVSYTHLDVYKRQDPHLLCLPGDRHLCPRAGSGGIHVRDVYKRQGYDRDQADQKEQQKTMAFLSRRGFSYEAILDIMHKKY